MEEIKKKDKIISTFKRNNETLKKELQLYQINNKIENINNTQKMAKELEERNNTINQISTFLRLILKDLSKKYEIEKNKNNLKGMNNTAKEEMLKLGLDEENLGEFIGNNENMSKTNEQIDILLNDIQNFNSEKAFKLYNTLFDNIRQLEIENINSNDLSFNNFNRAGNESNNNLSGKYSGINNNFIRGNNNFKNINLLESKI